jgi:hypothetical protein
MSSPPAPSELPAANTLELIEPLATEAFESQIGMEMPTVSAPATSIVKIRERSEARPTIGLWRITTTVAPVME